VNQFTNRPAKPSASDSSEGGASACSGPSNTSAGLRPQGGYGGFLKRSHRTLTRSLQRFTRRWSKPARITG